MNVAREIAQDVTAVIQFSIHKGGGALAHDHSSMPLFNFVLHRGHH
jgi:hypothetical protein